MAALLVLFLQFSGMTSRPTSADAEVPPHLGYGVNLRYLDNVDTIFSPLGFDWIKTYERFEGMPIERLPYQVLYRIDVNRGDRWTWQDSRPQRPDLAAMYEDFRAIAQQGLGLVEAYEIGNEPNMAWQWMDQPPDPADYVDVLRVAYTAIRAVDPGVIVVSGGLGPVGRIGGPDGHEATCRANSGTLYEGNDCQAMDERLYARRMFTLGAGGYLDAFGYHPAGFAYEPERALDDLPVHDNGNEFTFRGAEVMRAIMEEHGLGNTPVWGTEVGWLRDPTEDGFPYCHGPAGQAEFAPCEWFDMPEAMQAAYLPRAFDYADQHWPWMGVMFVWAFDFHSQGADCWHGRYFSVRKYGGPGDTEGSPTLAYAALAEMPKRPGHFGPRLGVTPSSVFLLAEADVPQVFTVVLRPDNTGYGLLAWSATVGQSLDLTPTLNITAGLQGAPLTMTVDAAGYRPGAFTGSVTVSATTTDVLGAPQVVPVRLVVAPQVYQAFLPMELRPGP